MRRCRAACEKQKETCVRSRPAVRERERGKNRMYALLFLPRLLTPSTSPHIPIFFSSVRRNRRLKKNRFPYQKRRRGKGKISIPPPSSLYCTSLSLSQIKLPSVPPSRFLLYNNTHSSSSPYSPRQAQANSNASLRVSGP